MAKYVLTYHGGEEPASEEEGERVMQTWLAWFKELGDRVVDAGAPIARAALVSADGSSADHGGPDQITGYSVITAASLDEAIDVAKSCPQLAANGTVEVGEAIDV